MAMFSKVSGFIGIDIVGFSKGSVKAAYVVNVNDTSDASPETLQKDMKNYLVSWHC